MKKIHILYLNDTPDTFGGGESQLLELVQGVGQSGIEALVACMPDSPLEAVLKAEGITTLPMGRLRSNPFMAVRTIKRLCRERSVDIIHTGSFLTNFSGRLASRSMKLPVVSTYHCEPDSYLLAGSGLCRRLIFLAPRTVERLTAGLTDAFIAVSHAVADKLVAQGVSPAKIKVISNGIDTQAVRTSAIEESADAREPGELVVATMARLDPVKGLDVLIRSVAILAAQRRRVKLLIIGDGASRGFLEKFAVDLGIEDKVEFTGYLDQPYTRLASSDIYAVSSLSEGQNISVLVAMSLGVPVIATRVGGIVDMVADRQSGLLVPPGDPQALAAAIESLADDENLRQRLVKGGEKVLPEFTIDRMCKLTIDVYRRLKR